MKYSLYKTAKKTAKENNLIPAVSKYYGGNDLFYDFSILDNAGLKEEEKAAIIAETMQHHAVSWYDQPLPLILKVDNFTYYCGQIKTAPHRVFKADGRRLMVIIEITAAQIEKQTRHDIWSELKTVETFTAKTAGHIDEDYEIA